MSIQSNPSPLLCFFYRSVYLRVSHIASSRLKVHGIHYRIYILQRDCGWCTKRARFRRLRKRGRQGGEDKKKKQGCGCWKVEIYWFEKERNKGKGGSRKRGCTATSMAMVLDVETDEEATRVSRGKRRSDKQAGLRTLWLYNEEAKTTQTLTRSWTSKSLSLCRNSQPVMLSRHWSSLANCRGLRLYASVTLGTGTITAAREKKRPWIAQRRF